MEELVIHPDRRNLGIGKPLQSEVKKRSAGRGAEGIIVPCGREGFYEKTGFMKCPITRYWCDIRPAVRQRNRAAL